MATCSLETLLEQACENRFSCLPDGLKWPVLLQLLCNFSEAGGGAVNSVFGRTGAVLAQAGDYDAFYVKLIGSTMSGLLIIDRNSIGATATDGLFLENVTAAAVAAQQFSPSLHWSGNGWKTNAVAGSQAVEFRSYLRPVQGTANPSGQLIFESRINGGAWGNEIVFDSGGEITLLDTKRIKFLDSGGNLDAAIWYETAHPRELHIDSGKSVYIGPGDGSTSNFTVQIGPASGAGGGAHCYLPRNAVVSGGNTTTRSQYLFFNSAWWNGSTTRFNGASIYASTDVVGNAILECDDTGTADGVGPSTSIAFRVKGDIMVAATAPAGSGVVFPNMAKQNAASTSSFNTITDAATVAFDAASYCNGEVTLEGNRTLQISGALNGQRGMLKINQDAAGSRTLAVQSNVATPSNGGIVLTTAPNSTDIYEWVFDGTLYNFVLFSGDSFAPFDAAAQAFITAAGITDLTQKKAVNKLVLDLKAASLWTKLDVIYPFVGGTAGAHAVNLKSPGTFDITWTGAGVTHDANGITGNGTTAYGNTGFNPTSAAGNFSLNASSIFAYVGVNNPVNNGRFISVASGAGTNRAGLMRTATVLIGADGINCGAIGNLGINVAAEFRGPVLASRTSSVLQTIYQNIGSQTDATASVAIANDSFFVLARNFGGADNFSDVNLRLAMIGGAMTGTDWTNLKTISDNYNLALGRRSP